MTESLAAGDVRLECQEQGIKVQRLRLQRPIQRQ